MNYIEKQIGFFLMLVVIFIASCSRPSVLTYQIGDTSPSSTSLDSIVPDTGVLAIIAPYKLQLDSKMGAVIGFSEKELVKGKYQSTLGNFIMDLILEKSEEYYGAEIDFGLVTTGGLRTPIPQGEVTVGNIYELMPFENELVVLTLESSTVAKLLAYAAKNGNAQFSGLSYTLHNERAKEVTINGVPFHPEKNYTMAVSDYLANGGDGLGFLEEAISYEQLGKTFRGAILEHLWEMKEENKTIVGQLDDRVILEGKN